MRCNNSSESASLVIRTKTLTTPRERTVPGRYRDQDAAGTPPGAVTQSSNVSGKFRTQMRDPPGTTTA